MSPIQIRSFDGTETCSTTLAAPRSSGELEQLLCRNGGALAIRGGGLSYPNAAVAADGTTVSTAALDRVIAFDQEAQTITVESGITVGAVLRYVTDRGLYFPALPGHPSITVGGCVAFNTHGKTQHTIGNFGDHVVSLTLFHPDHGLVRCSPVEHADLFELTVGGLGLTGFIAEVTLALQPLAGPSVVQRLHRVRDFVEAAELMDRLGSDDAIVYSWNDASTTGSGFGRGVVYEERFAGATAGTPTEYRPLYPAQRGYGLPFAGWNRATVQVANLAWRALSAAQREKRMSVLDAAFPIHGREGYFHLFGRRGLLEYQVLVPQGRWPDAVERVRRDIADTGACVTLSSLKTFAGQPRLLWFRADGVCLTIDGPATDRTRRLFGRLDALAMDLRAPVNLSKDSRLGGREAAAIFGERHDEFRARLRAFDPSCRFDSPLRRRIGV